jgi:hypothetical protein
MSLMPGYSRQARRGTREVRFRPSGGWRLDNMQWAADEYGADVVELDFLRAADKGQVKCSGDCGTTFRKADDIVLMVVWYASDEPLEIQDHGYCLDCTDRYGVEILDERNRLLAS